MTGPRIVPPSQPPHEDLRLLCLSHAGGNVSAFQRWARTAPPGIEVVGLEYPGRGTRVSEEPLTGFTDLLEDLLPRATSSSGRPYALFGHSMGGLVAFELAHALICAGMGAPRHLFISATAAPDVRPKRTSLRGALDDEVMAELRNLGGTPRILLDDPTVMAMAVRVLRADYTVLESYRHRDDRAPLDVPLTVMGGWEDTVTPLTSLTGWRRRTLTIPRFLTFSGDHFFVHTRENEVVDTVMHTLTSGPVVVPAPGTHRWKEERISWTPR